jgi:hypothetical protein
LDGENGFLVSVLASILLIGEMSDSPNKETLYLKSKINKTSVGSREFKVYAIIDNYLVLFY